MPKWQLVDHERAEHVSRIVVGDAFALSRESRVLHQTRIGDVRGLEGFSVGRQIYRLGPCPVEVELQVIAEPLAQGPLHRMVAAAAHRGQRGEGGKLRTVQRIRPQDAARTAIGSGIVDQLRCGGFVVDIPLGDWFNRRGALAAQGQSQMAAGLVSLNLIPSKRQPTPAGAEGKRGAFDVGSLSRCFGRARRQSSGQ